jgi:hypothetical protein
LEDAAGVRQGGDNDIEVDRGDQTARAPAPD